VGLWLMKLLESALYPQIMVLTDHPLLMFTEDFSTDWGESTKEKLGLLKCLLKRVLFLTPLDFFFWGAGKCSTRHNYYV